MIRCCTVNEYGSFSKVGTVLEKKIDQLNDAGYKILNVFETKVTKVPNCSDQAFIIIYDDGEKISNTYDVNKKYHTCGRCKYEQLPEDDYPCYACIYGVDNREDLWEAKDNDNN